MNITLNPRLASLPKFPTNRFPAKFGLTASNGMHLWFVRTSSTCPLQYDVFDDQNNKCAYVCYRSQTFSVKLPNLTETIFEMEGEELDSWQNEAFAHIAADVIEMWYETIDTSTSVA